MNLKTILNCLEIYSFKIKNEKSLEESLVGRDITAECGRILFSATDIYDILQVDRNADDRTVRGAYFRIMKQCHPDKVPREFAELATKAMAKVNDAFESYKTSRRTQ